MKKHTLFILFFILIGTVVFADVKIETFSTTSNTSTYNPTVVSRVCAQSTWTVYLGGILTNVGNFGSTNFAAPLRARTTTEQTANSSYAYLVSDSISGGVDSLWFDWNSNGSETGRTWNIRISVNGVQVGAITSAATAQIPLGGTMNRFKVGGLKKTGKFVIKIENLSNASSTGNEYRFVLDNLSWTTYVGPGEKSTPNLIFGSSAVTKVVTASDFTNSLTNTSDGIPAYSSSNESCVTIDSNTGQVHIVGLGTATITVSVPATTNFKAGSATYTIVIKPANWKVETFTNISNVCIVNPAATSCSTTPVTDLMDNNVSWTYWLSGGNTAIFGSNAMYMRARLSTETEYEYGYVKSDSISGGLSSLSFQWNQGGTEEGLTYKLAVIVNNDTIGFINDAGLNASFLTPKTFTIQNLTYSGKVVIKLENRTPYSGTSNKGRIVIDNLEWYGYTAIKTSTTASDFGLSTLTSNSDIAVSGTNTTLTIDVPTNLSSLNVNPCAKVTLNDGQTLSVGTFTLQSDDSGTATFVDNNTTPSPIVATVKQYLTSGRNWYFSSPISGATVDQLISNADSICYYDEPTAQWKKQTSGNLTPMKGYISAGTKTTGCISFNGTLNTGSQSILCTRTPDVSKSGFNLVANPYPSYVNIHDADTLHLEPSYWMRSKNEGNTAYVFDTYNLAAQEGTNLSGLSLTDYIPPMQAFWVRVRQGFGSGSLTLNNTLRSHQDVLNNKFRVSSAKNSIQQVLHLQISNGVESDEAILLFNPNASNGYDDYDSPKMINSNAKVPEIYTTIGTEKLVINGLKNIPYSVKLPLGFTTGISNTYTLKASQIKNFASGTQIILRDNLLDIEQDISNGSVYTFSSDAVTGSSRFSIIFKSKEGSTDIDSPKNDVPDIRVYKNTDNQIVITGRDTFEKNGDVVVCNSTGQKIYCTKLSGQTTLINKSFVSGIYVLIVDISGIKIIRKITI